jgi:hypothetical protein
MKTKFVVVSLLMMVGLVGGAALSRSGDAPGSAPPGVAATLVHATQSEAGPMTQSLTDPVTGAQLQLDTGACAEGSTSDAASCSDGGFVFNPNLGCCFLGTRGTLGKWTHGSTVKCCGACAGL